MSCSCFEGCTLTSTVVDDYTAFKLKHSIFFIGLLLIMAFSLVLWVGWLMGTNSLIFIGYVDVSVEKKKGTTEGSVGSFQKILVLKFRYNTSSLETE